MQTVIGGVLILLAFSINTHAFFQASIACMWILAICGSTNDMATDGNYVSALKHHEQSFYLGFQSAFYQVGKILSQGALVVLAGILFKIYNNYFTAWTIVILIMAMISFSAALYHLFVLPTLPKNEKLGNKHTAKDKFKDAFRVYKDFFKIEHIWVGLSFILFYRIGELLVMSIFPLFLKDTLATGGLGMSNEFVGLSYGTFGAAAAVIASLLGGYAIYKKGLRFWLIPMALIMNLPHVLYIYLAYSQNTNQLLISSFISLEQVAFTFGLAANMFLMMYLVRNSSKKTSHYAFLSGCMLLEQRPVKMVTGYLQQILGYEHLFILIFIMVIPSLICAYSVYRIIDPKFGRQEVEEDIIPPPYKLIHSNFVFHTYFNPFVLANSHIIAYSPKLKSGINSFVINIPICMGAGITMTHS